MIFVDRSLHPHPEFFNSNEYQSAEAKLKEFYKNDYRQTSFKYQAAIWVQVKPQLGSLFEHKCAYCESRVDNLYSGEVDHFRPKSTAVNLNGKQSEGYWWLAYKWNNLYLSCTACNRQKRNKFPVEGKRADYLESLAEEKYLLIDPCNKHDVDEAGFYYDNKGRIAAKSERGLITIELLSLNRTDLVRRRKDLIDRLELEFQLAIRESTSLTEIDEYGFLLKEKFSTTEYQGLINYFVNDWISSFNEENFLDLKSHFATSVGEIHTADSPRLKKKNRKLESQNYAHSFYQKTKLIKNIDITNFKAIKKLSLDYPQSSGDRESWMMIIGENGVGKSTILQAISLALAGQQHLDELDVDWSSLIRRKSGVRRAEVTVNLINFDLPIKLMITNEGAKVTPAEPQMIVLGYGSTRLLPQNKQSLKQEKFQSNIQNLFNQYSQLKDVESWLSDTDIVKADSFNYISKSLRELLMLPGFNGDEEVLLRRRSGKITVNLGRSAQNIYELCDGYKSVLAYVLDIMMSIYPFWSSPQNAQGVVLIDEIETHLHPSWKIKIVSLLRNIFPLMNFVVTTHDPLCLRGAKKGEIKVLNFSEKNELVLNAIDIPPGLPIEELLTGVWFKMESTLDEDTVSLVKRHSELVTKSGSEYAEERKRVESDLKGRVGFSKSSGLFGTFLETLEETLKQSQRDLSEEQVAEGIRRKLKNKLGGAN